MTNMNEHYSKAVAAVKGINSKTNSLWANLGMFVVSAVYANGVPPHGTDIKALFKEQEKAATAEAKVEMQKNSTYRVQKTLLVNCVAKGISLIDANGKLRGKTELEKELADTKVEKSELEKFKITCTTLTNIGAKLNASERITAAKLVQELLDSMTSGISLAA